MVCAWRGGELTQHGIHEGSGGTFAGTLHQFDAFVEGGALRDAIEPAELVQSKTQSDENFNVKLGSGCDDAVAMSASRRDRQRSTPMTSSVAKA